MATYDTAREDRYAVRSLVRGLRILECVERAGTPMRLTDLANALEIERATLFRYCATLVNLKYLHLDPKTKQYSLGLRARSLAHAASAQWPALVLVREFLPILAERFGGAASLGVLEGDQILYVERAVAGRTMTYHLSIGDRLPAAKSSMGKALLAFEPPTIVQQILRAQLPASATQSTFAEISLARETGIAYNLGAIQEGLHSVAVPVYDRGEVRPFGAINLAGSAFTLTFERLRDVVAPELQAFAARIARGES